VGVMLAEEAIHVEQNGSTRVLEDQVDLDQKPRAVEATSLPSVADSTINNAGPASAPLPAPSDSVEVPSLPEDPLDLTQFSSAQELEALGLERLKRELVSAGLKCGGTLSERAIRLFAIRGLDPNDYPMKLRATKASN
jgi:Replication stress response SDE2 C-terminal